MSVDTEKHNGSGYLSETGSKIDIFRNHQTLSEDASRNKEITGDLRLITEDGTEFYIPGISYFMSPKEWNTINLTNELNSFKSSLDEVPNTHNEFLRAAHSDTPEANKLVETLEGLTLLTATLNYINDNQEKVLEQFREANLIAPSKVLSDYNEIVSSNAEKLTQFFKFDLELSKGEIAKSANLALMQSSPNLDSFIASARAQNEEVALKTIQYTPDKLPDLLRNVTSEELTEYPTLIGPVMYSQEALKFEDNNLHSLGFKALENHVSNCVAKYLESSSSSKQLKVNQTAVKTLTQSLSSIAAGHYSDASKANKDKIISHLTPLLYSAERDSISFQKSLHDVFSDIDNKSKFTEFATDLVKPMTALEASHLPDGLHNKINNANSRVHFTVDHPDVDPDETPANVRSSSPVIRR